MKLTQISDKREKEKSKKRVIRLEVIGSNMDIVDGIIDMLLVDLKIVTEQRSYPKEINKIEVDIY